MPVSCLFRLCPSSAAVYDSLFRVTPSVADRRSTPASTIVSFQTLQLCVWRLGPSKFQERIPQTALHSAWDRKRTVTDCNGSQKITELRLNGMAICCTLCPARSIACQWPCFRQLYCHPIGMYCKNAQQHALIVKWPPRYRCHWLHVKLRFTV